MNVEVLVILLLTAALSFTLVGIVRRIAVHQKLLDLPNERSSHEVPTPRGGGLAIAISFLIAVSVIWAMQLMTGRVWFALIGSSAAVAIIGWLDDRHHLSAYSRILVHIGSAIFFVEVLAGYPASELIKWGVSGVWACFVFNVLVLVWGTNLFNFMDGIDGMAACEAVFIASSGAILNYTSGGEFAMTATLFGLAAATLGFLIWNWPPARIFMGDVGSGFLGFLIVALLMATSAKGTVPIEVLPILGGVFVVDATTTLFRRILRRDRWLEAHRTHAYQHMARRLGRHGPVTLMSIAINVFWLLPWAVATIRYPVYGRYFLTAALTPLVILSIMVGAGTREPSLETS